MIIKELIEFLNKNFNPEDQVLVMAKHSIDLISPIVSIDRVCVGKNDIPYIIIYDGRK